METEKNLLHFVTFKESSGKISAQAFEAGDFLNIFLRFLDI